MTPLPENIRAFEDLIADYESLLGDGVTESNQPDVLRRAKLALSSLAGSSPAPSQDGCTICGKPVFQTAQQRCSEHWDWTIPASPAPERLPHTNQRNGYPCRCDECERTRARIRAKLDAALPDAILHEDEIASPAPETGYTSKQAEVLSRLISHDHTPEERRVLRDVIDRLEAEARPECVRDDPAPEQPANKSIQNLRVDSELQTTQHVTAPLHEARARILKSLQAILDSGLWELDYALAQHIERLLAALSHDETDSR